MAKAKKAKTKKESSGSFLESKAFKSFMAKLYGWGAAVVIVGALFKIQHWPGAGAMLTLGLSTEALIFFISAFDKQKEYLWEKVYPELITEDEKKGVEGGEEKKSISDEINKMLEEAKIESEMVNKLGDGMSKLSETVTGLKDISDATLATGEYATNIRQASTSIGRFNDASEKTADAMTHLSEASGSSKEYFEQIKSASGNLSSLNSLYEMELNESTKHREAMGKYNETLSSLVENLSESSNMSVQLKDEFAKLNSNLASLNNIYGNMLNAMATRA
jgi:gliding motility-associated protein GldL